MFLLDIILWILVGGVAGYIAERLMGEDHSLVVNVALGIAGAFVMNIILAFVLGLTGGNLIAQLISGVAGACILIWVYRRYQKSQG